MGMEEWLLENQVYDAARNGNFIKLEFAYGVYLPKRKAPIN
jgi:hypothetical protein